jgi:hypothetical protein
VWNVRISIPVWVEGLSGVCLVHDTSFSMHLSLPDSTVDIQILLLVMQRKFFF